MSMLKKKIKNLISLIEDTDIDEIEVSSFWGAQKVRLSKNSKTSNSAEVAPVVTQPNQIIENKPIVDDQEVKTPEVDANDSIDVENIENKNDNIVQDLNLHEIKAPLVGTYYSSPKPSDPPFVNVGDKINKGDTVCIIEAMKIFNEIESDVSGIVKEICVDNGSPVEFDQIIIKISAE